MTNGQNSFTSHMYKECRVKKLHAPCCGGIRAWKGLYWEGANKLNTVEQEIFATGNFRDFRPQAIRVQEISANPEVEDLPSFKISPCLSNLDHY